MYVTIQSEFIQNNLHSEGMKLSVSEGNVSKNAESGITYLLKE